MGFCGAGSLGELLPAALAALLGASGIAASLMTGPLGFGLDFGFGGGFGFGCEALICGRMGANGSTGGGGGGGVGAGGGVGGAGGVSSTGAGTSATGSSTGFSSVEGFGGAAFLVGLGLRFLRGPVALAPPGAM